MVRNVCLLYIFFYFCEEPMGLTVDSRDANCYLDTLDGSYYPLISVPFWR